MVKIFARFVLALKVFCVFSFCEYINLENCKNRLIFQDRCIDICPIGFNQIDKYCHKSFQPIISLITSLHQENCPKSSLNKKERNDSNPLPVPNIGLFFNESSRLLIPKSKANIEILSFCIDIRQSGQILSDNKKFISLEVKPFEFELNISGEKFSINFSDFVFEKWINIKLTLYKEPQNSTLDLNISEKSFKSLSIPLEFTTSEFWIIGKSTSNSYIGFITNFNYFIDQVEIPDSPEPKICSRALKDLNTCETQECLTALCESHTKRKLSCIDPNCQILAGCPNFYSADSNNICRVNPGDSGFYHCFDNFKQTFSTCSGSTSYITSDTVLPYTPGRGKYFNGYNSKYYTQNQYKHSISPAYSMWIKVEKTGFNGITCKDNLFDIYTTETQIMFNLKGVEKSFNGMKINEWVFIRVLLTFSSVTYTEIKAYVDSQLLATDAFTTVYHFTEFTTINFGYANGYYLKGWYYFSGYNIMGKEPDFGVFNNNLGCKTLSLMNIECMENCPVNYYTQSGVCTACPSSCPNCKNSNNCENCVDPACVDCVMNRLGRCNSCGSYYEISGFCYAQCPIMYTLSGSSCSRQTGTLSLDLSSSSWISSTPNLIRLNQIGK